LTRASNFSIGFKGQQGQQGQQGQGQQGQGQQGQGQQGQGQQGQGQQGQGQGQGKGQGQGQGKGQGKGQGQGQGKGGMGGPGQGKGGSAPFGKRSKNIVDSKVSGKVGQGEMIGVHFHKGLPDKTSTEIETSPSIPSVKQEEEEEINRTRIPRALRGVVKNYFDEWRKEFPGKSSGDSEEPKKEKPEPGK